MISAPTGGRPKDRDRHADKRHGPVDHLEDDAEAHRQVAEDIHHGLTAA
jgi:hypothetical protein